MRTEVLPCASSCRYKRPGKDFPCAFGLLWSGELQFVCTQIAEGIQKELEAKLGQPINLTASSMTANFWKEGAVVATIKNGNIAYPEGD